LGEPELPEGRYFDIIGTPQPTDSTFVWSLAAVINVGVKEIYFAAQVLKSLGSGSFSGSIRRQ
jgi:hypothetical protein